MYKKKKIDSSLKRNYKDIKLLNTQISLKKQKTFRIKNLLLHVYNFFSNKLSFLISLRKRGNINNIIKIINLLKKSSLFLNRMRIKDSLTELSEKTNVPLYQLGKSNKE